eukprot:4072877-Pleurochrysis_carterae.AAC.2
MSCRAASGELEGSRVAKTGRSALHNGSGEVWADSALDGREGTQRWRGRLEGCAQRIHGVCGGH